MNVPREFMIVTSDCDIIHIWQGDALNLFEEDIENGYVDIMFWGVYEPRLSQGTPCFIENANIESNAAYLTMDYEEHSLEELVDIVLDWVYGDDRCDAWWVCDHID